MKSIHILNMIDNVSLRKAIRTARNRTEAYHQLQGLIRKIYRGVFKEEKILEIRGQHVIIDSDVAALYNVETKRINEAVKNNPDKFPSGYYLELDSEEKDQLVENFDRFEKLKHSTTPPKAFTERGMYMLATILKSAKATETTLAIIDTFRK